ncbi:MAG: hypothetical protein KDI75_06315 [Xanthomonadales bacterium]|nr:hypothetical protein [Xanthomonadales bacterium]
MNELSLDVLKSFRHPLRGCRVHFLCLSKENGTKTNDTPRPHPLRWFVSRIRGFRQFIHELTKTHARPVRAPDGPIRLHLTAAEGAKVQKPRVKSSGICRVLLVAVAVFSLSACERTRFVEAPADATGCSRELVGNWLNEASDDSKLGEVAATVSGDCQLQVTENDKSPPRLSPPTQLRSARIGDIDVLWIDAAWADAAFEIEADAITPAADSNAHDVYAYAWKRDGERLTLTAPDHVALAHAAIDSDIKAEVLEREYELHVRVREPQKELASLIASGKVFTHAEGGSRSLNFVHGGDDEK